MLRKKNIYAVWSVILLLFVLACQKNDNTKPSTAEQGIAFSMDPQSTLKSSDCFSKKADYAKVVISNVLYKVDVFYIDSKPYTNTIKLPVGDYTLSEFILMDDNNTPNDTSDDVVIAATPHAGSEFAAYVDQPLDILFTIEAFKKTEMGITVLCYQESDYLSFGFVFYQIGQVTVREQFFFGDICIKSLSDYDGSPYMNQSNGLQLDMPAIAKIEVWRNGVKMGEYTNESWYGEGQPLTVRYGDTQGQIDNFEFKLFIMVRQGIGFNYVYFHSWNFKDAELIPSGNDGVVDFVLGNCLPNADLILPPWMNLPPTATYTITAWNPATLGGYVDVTLSNISPGYEMYNGIYASFCADHASPIFVMQQYNMALYSSLYQNQLPAFAQSGKWEKINWLYNHLDWYPGYHWYDVQGFVWLYDNPPWNGAAIGNMPALTALTQQMKLDADQYGVGYKVPSGGWAAVVFIPVGNGNTPVIQTMFIQVDP
jgi:hypothetical protein